MTGHGTVMATQQGKQWTAQNMMAFTMFQAHSVHIHLTSHTRIQGCQDDLGIPLVLMDIKIISALTRQNDLKYKKKDKNGYKTISRRGYRYAETTQLRTANYQFYTTKFCLRSITFTPKHVPQTNDGMEHHSVS